MNSLLNNTFAYSFSVLMSTTDDKNQTDSSCALFFQACCMPLLFVKPIHFTKIVPSFRRIFKKIGKQTVRSEEHTSELQSRFDLVCRLLLEKKKDTKLQHIKDSVP